MEHMHKKLVASTNHQVYSHDYRVRFSIELFLVPGTRFYQCNPNTFQAAVYKLSHLSLYHSRVSVKQTALSIQNMPQQQPYKVKSNVVVVLTERKSAREGGKQIDLKDW